MTIASALVLAGCGDWAAPEPGLERMTAQRRVDPFAPSALTADGAAMQPPPSGTVAVEDELDPALAHGIVDGAYATRIPVPVTMALLRRGQDRFTIYCAACHGDAGDGHGPVADDLALVKPRDLHLAAVREQPDGRIFRTISEGFGLMPPYAVQLPIADRWAVVAYVRALQLSQRAEVAALPDDIRAEAQANLP